MQHKLCSTFEHFAAQSSIGQLNSVQNRTLQCNKTMHAIENTLQYNMIHLTLDNILLAPGFGLHKTWRRAQMEHVWWVLRAPDDSLLKWRYISLQWPLLLPLRLAACRGNGNTQERRTNRLCWDIFHPYSISLMHFRERQRMIIINIEEEPEGKNWEEKLSGDKVFSWERNIDPGRELRTG